ncbi:hypothetical protein ACMYYO_09275 [Dermacoccaceae bacterium W4C1]
MPPQPQVPMKTVLSHIAVPVLMGFIMCAAYLGGFHKPAPHHVPVAIVGQGQQVESIATSLRSALGDKGDVTVVPTEQEAQRQLKHLDIYGAYVPSQDSATVLVVAAGSDAAKSVAVEMLSPIAAKQQVPLHTVDVTPLPDSDPVGQNAFFFLVGITVGSYATSIGIGAAGASRRLRERTGLALGSAVLITTVGLLIARLGYGMFSGHEVGVWALSLVYTAGILLIGVGLHPLVGRFATLLYSAVFVALNFTTSGGVFPPMLQPAFYSWLHNFWIGAGLQEGLRRLLYFPDLSLGGPLGILFGWLALGVVCIGLAAWVERRRTQADVTAPQGKHSHSHLSAETETELEEDVAV